MIAVKPFLLVATRADDEVADDEYEGFLAAGGLSADALRRIRLESDATTDLAALDLADYSGVVVGGSPFTVSDPERTKSDTQLRVERQLGGLLARIVERDFPLLGACYGIGLLTGQLNGVVDGTWAEPAGPASITLTAEGRTDPLFGSLAETFDAFVGHKEACTVPPDGAVVLATGRFCPVQAFRIGRNVYATQFHPELTRASILTRVRTYRDNGYFHPASLADVERAIRASAVTEPSLLVRRFVEVYSEPPRE